MANDALQALIGEVVDLEEQLRVALAVEEEASVGAVAARQAFDAEHRRRVASEQRLKTTQQALDLIRSRDDISNDTVETLRRAVRRPRKGRKVQ